QTAPTAIKAAPHRSAAPFGPHSIGPVDDLIAPIGQTLIDTRIGTGFGVTTGPHLQELRVTGPSKVPGLSATPSRRAIFTCRPPSPGQERKCASDILRR